MAKITIAIAAYNIENYIGKCIESCINQSHRDLEIVVVNDGSTDNTLKVIEDYKKRDDRIKIVNQENRGIVEAREAGYRAATGEYILFIDGDDWLNLKAIEKLYQVAVKEKSDLVCCKYMYTYDNGKEIVQNLNIDLSTKNEDYDFLKKLLVGDFTPSIYTKLIKKAFMDKSKIEFPEGISYGDDLALIVAIGVNNPKYSYLDESLYYYYSREDSITSVISPKLLEIKDVTEFMEKKLKEKGIYNRYKEEFEYAIYIHNFWAMRDVMFKSNSAVGKKIFENWKKYNLDIRKNKYYKDVNKNGAFLSEVARIIMDKYYGLGSIIYKLKG